MIAAWLSVLFRLANFSIVIGLVVYLYKRYVRDYITHQIEHEHTIEQGLCKERDEAYGMYAHYKESVARKKEQRMVMQQAIMRWREAVASNDAQRVVERASRVQSLKIKSECQMENIRASVVMHKVLPEAIVRAHKKLEIEYSSEKEGVAFVQRIIAHLQESKS